MLALGPDRQMCFPARGSRGQRGDLLAPSVCLVGPRTSRVWAAPGDGAAWPLSVAVTGAFVVETVARRGEVLRKQGCHGPPIPKMQGGWRSLFPDPSCLGQPPAGT